MQVALIGGDGWHVTAKSLPAKSPEGDIGHRDEQPAARPQHPLRFGQCMPGTAQVLEDLAGRHDIEALVRLRQQVPIEVQRVCPVQPFSPRERRPRNVAPMDRHTWTGRLHQTCERSIAAAEIQEPPWPQPPHMPADLLEATLAGEHQGTGLPPGPFRVVPLLLVHRFIQPGTADRPPWSLPQPAPN